MKIVLLDTGRGVTPETIRMWRENLQLTERDTVALMAWQPPREPLPVTEHYVFGPQLRLRTTEPRHVQTAGDIIGGHDIDAAQLATEATRERDDIVDGDPQGDPDGAEIGTDDSPMSESDLAGQLPEAVAETGDHSQHWEATEYDDGGHDDRGAQQSSDGSDDVEPRVTPEAGGDSRIAPPSAVENERPAGTTGSTVARTNPAHLKVAHLPRTDPARLAHGVTWRVNKVRIMGRRVVKGGARRLKRSLKVGNNPVAKAAQRALATRNGSIATQFAFALARSSEAAELFRAADLVFPVDARSQRGAWLLARANQGPDVMVGYPAAIRALERRRASR